MKTCLKICKRLLSEHTLTVLMAATIIIGGYSFHQILLDASFWQFVAITPEPGVCSVCQNGASPCYRAPVLIHLTTGEIRELEDYVNTPFAVHIGNNSGPFNPKKFCHDCRALLVETSTKGYVLLDLNNLESIRAFAVKNKREYLIRDYTVSIFKDTENGGLSVKVNHCNME